MYQIRCVQEHIDFQKIRLNVSHTARSQGIPFNRYTTFKGHIV